MTMTRNAQIVAAVASLLCAPGLALAQDAIATPAQKTIGGQLKMVPSLAVLNSGGASLADGKLTMNDVGTNSIVFADRPVRAAGHVLTREFIKQWDEGNDSFAKDPPNATISVLNEDGNAIEDAVVVLKKPTLEGNNLTFEVAVLEGDLKGADGPASLFIDWFAARGGFGHVGGSAGLAGMLRSGTAAGMLIPEPITAPGWPREPYSARLRRPLTGLIIPRLADIILTRPATSGSTSIF